MSPQLHTDSLNLYEQFQTVRRKLSEITASFWTDLEVYSELNKAQIYIARKTKILKRTAQITTTASTQTYDLNSTSNGFPDIIDISEDGVEFNQNGTTRQPLEYTNIWKLNKDEPGWRDVAASTPNKYYWNKASKVIGLHAKPNSSNAGAYLFVSGYHKPKRLHAGTAAAGADTTLTLAAGSSTVQAPSTVDDYYNDIFIEIYSGTGQGERARITDYAGSTRVCTVDFTTTPSTDTIYGMVPQIPESSMYLMELYAMSKMLEKGGSRTTLADRYWNQFMQGLSLAISESIESDDETLVKDSYRA